MGTTTKIEWCDSTLNLLVGCDGCELEGEQCYARTLVSRYAGLPGWPGAFDRPEFFLDRLEAALRWPDLTGKPRPAKPWLDGLPRLVFLDDLADPFTESVDLEWLHEPLRRMADSPHVWLVLTKRPKRFAQFARKWEHDHGPLPGNLWGGVSVTSQKTIRRVEDLCAIDLAVRFVSAEPLWGPVDLRPYLICQPFGMHPRGLTPADGWVIAGGQSGRPAKPSHPDWFRSLRDQCQTAGVPFFFKQWGEWAPYSIGDDPGPCPTLWLGVDGTRRTIGPMEPTDAILWRPGKQAAGRLLDGRQWNEVPNTQASRI